jgi:hypothetical protein
MVPKIAISMWVWSAFPLIHLKRARHALLQGEGSRRGVTCPSRWRLNKGSDKPFKVKAQQGERHALQGEEGEWHALLDEPSSERVCLVTPWDENW